MINKSNISEEIEEAVFSLLDKIQKEDKEGSLELFVYPNGNYCEEKDEIHFFSVNVTKKYVPMGKENNYGAS